MYDFTRMHACALLAIRMAEAMTDFMSMVLKGCLDGFDVDCGRGLDNDSDGIG
jgi:hypothetical protein